MSTRSDFQNILRTTEIVQFPRYRIATFGDTEIAYNLVTPEVGAPDRAVWRQGRVNAARPKILTAENLVERFEGFGDGAEEFAQWLKDVNLDAWRALQYRFSNRLEKIQKTPKEARALVSDLQRDLNSGDHPRSAVILGPAVGWQFALLKFIMDETQRSFQSNVRELEERGLFDPAQGALSRRRREIESLFQSARQDPGALKILGAKLRDWGVFEEYQDRFFKLIARN